MSEYKKGDKFIIELDEQAGDLWKIKGFNALVFDDFGLDKLGQLVQGVDQYSYNKGADDAWKLIKKMYIELATGELKEIFNLDDSARAFNRILKHLNYQYAAAKVEEWERQRAKIEDASIYPGDVFMHKESNWKVVVTHVFTDKICFIWHDGMGEEADRECFKDDFAKVDRNINIGSVLKELEL